MVHHFSNITTYKHTQSACSVLLSCSQHITHSFLHYAVGLNQKLDKKLIAAKNQNAILSYPIQISFKFPSLTLGICKQKGGLFTSTITKMNKKSS